MINFLAIENYRSLLRLIVPLVMFRQVADINTAPEVIRMRENIRGWRFYDNFRTDGDAPARVSQLGTRTPVLHHDGRDLAATLQAVREIGNGEALDEAVRDAFPGSRLDIVARHDTRFSVEFHQSGLLRPLSGAELSDGTLRYLLWVAALLTPRAFSLMVLNEPETSLHPDLLPALARLIIHASEYAQVWVVTHSNRFPGYLSRGATAQSVYICAARGFFTIFCLKRFCLSTHFRGFDFTSSRQELHETQSGHLFDAE